MFQASLKSYRGKEKNVVRRLNNVFMYVVNAILSIGDPNFHYKSFGLTKMVTMHPFVFDKGYLTNFNYHSVGINYDD